MTTRKLGCWLALAGMLVNLASPVLAQEVVAPAAPQATLWSFLGIPQAFKAVREGGINRSGNHPALEKKPPLKKISDPANLKSENPAIKKAAEIKKEEDLKWQKIKAIKYLTTIGCGCYNRDGSITDALMKAMDDCTEEVRYATVLAITGAAGGEMCANCKMRSCCSEEISNKLYELAYERDDEGCFLEPSERVRLAAAEALRTCCPGRGDDFFIERPTGPTEVPQGGEQPGVVPPTGGERPLDAPPPAPPMPPVPTPALRPISEPSVQRTQIPHQEVQRQASLPRTVVAQPAAPATTQPAPAPAQPVTKPAKTPSPQQSSRRTAIQPNAAQPPVVISKPVDPARPIAPQAATARPVPSPVAMQQPRSVVSRPASQATRPPENFAPIVSAAEIRRLPPPDDVVQPASATVPPLQKVVEAPAPKAILVSQSTPQPVRVPQTIVKLARPIGVAQPLSADRQPQPGEKFGAGTVASIRLNDGVAILEFAAAEMVPGGAIVRTYHDHTAGDTRAVCDLKVVSTAGGVAVAVPHNGGELSALAIGDQAIVLR